MFTLIRRWLLDHMETKLFRENGLIFLGICIGEKLNYFMDLGSKGKILFGSQEMFFQEFVRSMHYFVGSKAA